MTTEQFCYWLQGFAEIKGGWEEPTAQEWKVIKDHLELVFKKETPPYNLPVLTTKEMQKKFEDVRDQMRDGAWQWPHQTLITC